MAERSESEAGTAPCSAAAEVLQRAVEDGAFPAAAFGILHRGSVRCLGATGHFTYDIASPAATVATRFDLASLTKVVATTAMAMLLWQRGALALDAPLAAWLPQFAGGADARRRAVTLRMLLAHSSGLPAIVPLYESCGSAAEARTAVLALPLEAEPGTRAAYSDPGFMLLGMALEKIAGVSLDRFCTEHVFAPLGMDNTGFTPAPSLRASIPPTELTQAGRTRPVQGEVHDENCRLLGGVTGHAGLFAPVGDVLRFAEALLAPLHGRAESIFTSETVRLFTQRAGLPPGSSRALGWDTPSRSESNAVSSSGTLFSSVSFGHLGYTGTSLWIDPLQNAAAVLLTNRTFPTRENKKIQQVRPQFHDAIMRRLEDGTFA